MGRHFTQILPQRLKNVRPSCASSIILFIFMVKNVIYPVSFA